MMDAWCSDGAVSRATEETSGMSREQLIARLTSLAPSLTEEALRGVVVFAMTAPKRSIDVAAQPGAV